MKSALRVRPRRLRRTGALRGLVRETSLAMSDLIAPIFVTYGTGRNRPIASMPGISQLSVDLAVNEARELLALGVGGLLLFGIPEHKDDEGTAAWDENGPVPSALRALRKEFPDAVLMADVCLDEYTAHGHCGVLHTDRHGAVSVDNDATLERLARIALLYARSGADVVAPSDMMDGRVARIRDALDQENFTDVIVLSYAVKYASAFYGPFRDAAECAPQFGDRAGYQMDPANVREALRELQLDIDEGADMVMVKPALAYLDVIAQVRAHTQLPVAAYNVSGEYAMLHAGARAGWIDLKRCALESLLGIRRAGADVIITYHARDVAGLLPR